MNYLILYLIKSSICLGVFLILYRAFLHNSTLFRFNRWVILTGTMVCCLLPLAKMETENNMLQYPMRYLESVLNIENSLTGKTINIRLSDSEDNNSFLTAGDNKVISGNQQSKVGFLNISYAAFIIMFLFVIYVTGVIVKTIFFISKIRKMKNLKDGSFHEKYNGFNLYITPQNIHPFCWGTSIYISEKDFDEKEESILIHETMHLKSRHTIDLIYFNILSNIFWFNPAISRLYSDLKLIHEFEADQAVLNNGINANKYQLLIVKKTVGARQFSLANSFGHSQLKARINMMLKEKTNGKAKLRVLIFAPAMIFMMYFFSGSAIASIMVTEQDKKSDKIEEKTDDGELVIFVPLSNEAIKGSKILFDVAGKKEPVELKDFSEKSFILKINEMRTNGDSITSATLYLPKQKESGSKEKENDEYKILMSSLRNNNILKVNFLDKPF